MLTYIFIYTYTHVYVITELYREELADLEGKVGKYAIL